MAIWYLFICFHTPLKEKKNKNNTLQQTYAESLDTKTFSKFAANNTTMTNNFFYWQDMKWKKSEMGEYMHKVDFLSNTQFLQEIRI